jgi:hypothetical protein
MRDGYFAFSYTARRRDLRRIMKVAMKIECEPIGYVQAVRPPAWSRELMREYWLKK